MDQTTIWMLGVVGFGIAFYAYSVYYAKRAAAENK